MPEYLRGETRDKVTYVKIGNANSTVYYGFNAKDIKDETNVTQQDVQALGHIAGDALPQGAIYFLRASSPKPGRAVKILRRNPTVNQKGSVSTFYGAGSARTAMSAGWKLRSRPRGVTLTQNARTVTAIAQLSNGVLYCFPLNKKDFDTYRGSLGLKAPTEITTDAERLRLVSGSSYPRPGRVSLDLGNGSQFSTFFSTNSENAARGGQFSIVTLEYVD